MIVYTDGSCSPDGFGGWSFIVVDEDRNNYVERYWGSEQETSNNRMELTAAINALKHFSKKDLVVITDSEYLKKGITEWVKKWQFNGWKTAAKKPVENKDLWQELLELSRNKKIEWRWVKSHNGTAYNEEADRLATEARVKQSMGKLCDRN